MTAKGVWRARMRRYRRSLTAARRERAERALTERILGLLHEESPRTIGVYAATRNEASLDAVVAAWDTNASRTVAWPRVLGPGRMTFHAARLAELLPAHRGIREPDPTAEEIPLDALDLLLVPGLAFDRRGGRLGQGGGFYDRVLNDPRLGALTVGVAFAIQIVAQVPREPHDARVARVVTDRGRSDGRRWTP